MAGSNLYYNYLHMTDQHMPIKRERLKMGKNKTQLYVVCKKLTLSFYCFEMAFHSYRLRWSAMA